jgi:hypothetical protein
MASQRVNVLRNEAFDLFMASNTMRGVERNIEFSRLDMGAVVKEALDFIGNEPTVDIADALPSSATGALSRFEQLGIIEARVDEVVKIIKARLAEQGVTP